MRRLNPLLVMASLLAVAMILFATTPKARAHPLEGVCHVDH